MEIALDECIIARVVAAFFRFFYRHFYNRLAFTYDFVSARVSDGEWREWTRAAIPYVRGKRVLEIACGTGNLLLDLHRAGYAPIGVDLSPYMLAIARRKMRAQNYALTLARARAQALPFATDYFDALVMTFPPGLVRDPRALDEMRRVLRLGANLIWVDAAHLYPRTLWTRGLNFALALSGGNTPRDAAPRDLSMPEALPRDGWRWRVERIERVTSFAHVFIGTKE